MFLTTVAQSVVFDYKGIQSHIGESNFLWKVASVERFLFTVSTLETLVVIHLKTANPSKKQDEITSFPSTFLSPYTNTTFTFPSLEMMLCRHHISRSSFYLQIILYHISHICLHQGRKYVPCFLSLSVVSYGQKLSFYTLKIWHDIHI